ncbi:MAG: hypothetical protein WKF63_05060 [Thermomicrobiales bacterium]
MKRLHSVPIMVLITLLLASCGNDDGGPTLQTETPATMIPTVPAGALTVGEILTGVEAAWPSVQSMTSTFWSAEGPASETPPTTGTVTVEDVILPADRRVKVLTDGEATDEQVMVRGRVYMKGALVPAAIAPMVDNETWVEVDPAAADANSPISMQLGYLLSPIQSPFNDISVETAALEAVPSGEITVDGRRCNLFTFGDPAGISYELALDAEQLPCRLVQTAAGQSNVTVYDFNDPELTITAPTLPDQATPAQR